MRDVKGDENMSAMENEFVRMVYADAEKYNGIRRPLKSSLLRRLLVKKLPCDKMHMNPDDEFTDPKIGPSMRIIGEYGETIRHALDYNERIFAEPVQVERMAPDGYMLLNGHHRWGAAVRNGIPEIRVKIVNLTTEDDLLRMMDRSRNSRRISFDLDEVLLAKGDEPLLEKPRFPACLLYRQRLRPGAAALLSSLRKNGYDIWVYTAGYYSVEALQALFRGYRLKVDGIINGVTQKKTEAYAKNAALRERISRKYRISVHADNEGLVWTDSELKSFRTEELNLRSPAEWSARIQEILKRLEQETGVAEAEK